MKHWLAIRDLVADALERPADQRAAFLSERGARLPPAALAEARQLVAAAEASPVDALAPPTEGLAAAIAADGAVDALPDHIGPWRIVRLLGEGGMGSVYLAERADGAYEREVALKLVRTSAQLGHREVRALARLEHPRIARLYDAGQFDIDGQRRWYFVMERITGIPLDEAFARVSVVEKVMSIEKLSAAVAFAHEAGVVHGDLKADNVLVDAAGEPHVVDFGVAQLLQADGLGDLPPLGRNGGRTALAPTSTATASRISWRADLHALAHLLNDSLPNAADDPGLRAVIGKGSAAHPRGGYPSVRAFGEDLARWRKGYVPDALVGHASYRARRWGRRHRWYLLAAAVLVLVAWGAFRQNQRTTAAQRASAEQTTAASAAAAAMISEVHDALNGMNGDVEARARVLNTAIDLLGGHLAHGLDPATTILLAEAYYKVGYVQGMQGNPSLGRVGDAAASFRAGLEALATLPPTASLPDSLHRSRTIIGGRLTEKLGAALAQGGDVAGGQRVVDSAVHIFRTATTRFPGDGEVATYYGGALVNLGDFTGHPYFPNLGDAEGAFGQYVLAEAVLSEIPTPRRILYTERLQGLTYERMGLLLRERRDWPGAKRVLGEAIAFQEGLLERGVANRAALRDLTLSRQMLGTVYLKTEEPERAMVYFDSAVAYFRERVALDPADLGARHDLSSSLIHVGDAWRARGEPAGAREAYREARAMARRVVAADTSAVRARATLAEAEERLE